MEPSLTKASKLLKQTKVGGGSDILELDLIEGAEKRAQFLSLLNQSFGVPAKRSFFQDFPIWDEAQVPSGAEITRLGIYLRPNPQADLLKADSPVLAAGTGVRLAELRTGVEQASSTIKVALIGAVATDPRFRERGLATQLVRTAIQWAEQRGACAIFLWGSEHRMYQKLGFNLCGEQQIILLSDLLNLVRPQRAISGICQSGWTPGIFELMKKRPLGLNLLNTDRSWIASHHQDSAQGALEWYYTGSPDAPSAYTALGRGIDLSGIIHEWGGHPEDLRRLWSTLLISHPNSKELKVLGSIPLFSQIGYDTSMFPGEFHCLAKIIEPEKIFKSYVTDAGDHQQALLTLRSTAEGELPQLLFGPGGFKLPLWLWGLDAA